MFNILATPIPIIIGIFALCIISSVIILSLLLLVVKKLKNNSINLITDITKKMQSHIGNEKQENWNTTHCEYCGTTLDKTVTNCPNCGAKKSNK